MESTARIHGHPVHPMLIPYPFALLTSSVVFDLAAAGRPHGSASTTARDLTRAGLASALVAAIPGIVDYFGTVPPRTTARRSATAHAVINLTALACFKVAQRYRGADGRLSGRGLGLAVAGGLALCAGGWIGGNLVYRERIGVEEEGGAARAWEIDRATNM
jgi:uncharacterized membrane protein